MGIERQLQTGLPKFTPTGAAADLSVILVSYNTENLLAQCIDALRRASDGLRVQVVAVDNASRDTSPARLRELLPDGLVLDNKVNVGFGRANNQALEHCTGRHLLLLNTDAFISPEALRKSLEFMDVHPRCGVLGAQLVGRAGEPQPSCRSFPTPWNRFLAHTGLHRVFSSTAMVDRPDGDPAVTQACDWVPGCFYLVRHEVVRQVGLFDARFFLYYEEVDHCRAVKAAGWEVMYCPDVRVVHLGGESAKSDSALTTSGRQILELQIESELLYFRKHHGAAGVWLAMLLECTSETLLALNGLLRRGAVRGALARWHHLAASWSLFNRTRFGTRATR